MNSGTFKDLLYKHSALHMRSFPLGDLQKFTKFLQHLDGVTHYNYQQGTGFRHALNDQVINKVTAMLTTRRNKSTIPKSKSLIWAVND